METVPGGTVVGTWILMDGLSGTLHYHDGMTGGLHYQHWCIGWSIAFLGFEYITRDGWIRIGIDRCTRNGINQTKRLSLPHKPNSVLSALCMQISVLGV